MTLFPDPLYPIADAGSRTRLHHLAVAEAILTGGVRLLQLRLKDAATGDFVERAREMKALCDRHGAALIVNDRADVAKLVDAHGVHLGQEDLPVAAARQVLGPSKWIGLSTHSLAQAQVALEAGGIDYLAFGPVFPTSSKKNPDPVQGLEGLREVRRICPLPLVAIGGITRDRIPDVLGAGADAVAVISAICDAEDPAAATRDLLQRARQARS